MVRLYHPDRQQHRVKNGTARYADIDVYERKIARCNKAAKILKVRANRERHAKKVASFKQLRKEGKAEYDRARREKLREIQRIDKEMARGQRGGQSEVLMKVVEGAGVG